MVILSSSTARCSIRSARASRVLAPKKSCAPTLLQRGDVEVDDEWAFADIDTPEEYVRAAAPQRRR